MLGLRRGETQQAGQVVKLGLVPVLLEASHPLGEMLQNVLGVGLPGKGEGAGGGQGVSGHGLALTIQLRNYVLGVSIQDFLFGISDLGLPTWVF